MNIAQIARQVLQCQDACNLGALVRSWSEWMPEIRKDAEARRIPANHHPCNVWMANKIAQLADSESFDMQNSAYAELIKISEGG
jgi:hypothetical protein